MTLDADPLPAPPPSGEPSQVVETWQPTVFFAPDPANGGRDTPTLFGRVYLFGPELKYPMIGEGKLVVDLYSGPIPRGATVAPLEEWQFDPVTLKRLAKRDPHRLGLQPVAAVGVLPAGLDVRADEGARRTGQGGAAVRRERADGPQERRQGRGPSRRDGIAQAGRVKDASRK